MNFKGSVTSEAMINEALKLGQGSLNKAGAFVIETGKYTGRAVDARYVVDRPETHSAIDWNKVNKPLDSVFADSYFAALQKRLSEKQTYTYRGFVGFFPIEVTTCSPWHAAFAANMFRTSPSPVNRVDVKALPTIKIWHDPAAKVSDLGLEFSAETLIALDPSKLQVAIVGTGYAGEIKKSAFTLCNFKTPEFGIFPMHSSANCLEDGSQTSVMFGLSGTGKTTLSADPKRALIGDDEILWSTSGVSNLEGGCYAKLIDLDPEKEPDIFQAVSRPGAIQENVVMDPTTKEVDFYSRAKTENTRGSYPLNFLKKVFKQDVEAAPATSIVFLMADAFGAMPAAAKLNHEQAQYYFLSGYTAKVAGTELGVKEPQAAFSPCFGAPFMPRRPAEYAQLLKSMSEKSGAQVWLLNTGWMKGGYGKAKRFPIPVSRTLLTAIQTGELDKQPRVKHPVFGFEVPTSCPGIGPEFLAVADGAEVEALAEKFLKNAAAWKDVDTKIIEMGGPRSSSVNSSAALKTAALSL